MHRSGTSMMASFLQALGVDVGEDLLPPNTNNRKGYFEDRHFVEFHQAVFRAACPDEPGWVEVGWTESERLDQASVQAFEGAARSLIAARRDLPVWGWKDPRTSLLLPFWDSLVPAARYVLVYRYPWDVVDSLYRARHDVFRAHPDYALRIWMRYNRALLDFYRQHPTRCVLINTNVLMHEPARLIDLLTTKLDLPVHRDPAVLARLCDLTLMNDMAPAGPVPTLMRQLSPDTMDLLDALDAAADLPGPRAWPPIASAAPAVAQLHQAYAEAWQANEAEAQRADRLAAQAGALSAQVGALSAHIDALQEALSRHQQTLAALWGSSSWKLTAPLRAIAQRCRKP
jgi:hypothetical protein